MLGGLALVVVAAGISHDSRMFMLGGLLVVGGVLRLTTALASDARRRRKHPVDPSDPRWHGGAGITQLAGRTCIECGRRITIGADGMSCSQCHAPAHIDCEELHLAHAHGPEIAFPFR
ncbi:MAG: hypothetical protein KF764_16145 [Labilithrix sp.]|nr:hypothetical protein [Labilithrix sp.]MBX3221792.1 hypothetical protein [Labilithrix sp.]